MTEHEPFEQYRERSPAKAYNSINNATISGHVVQAGSIGCLEIKYQTDKIMDVRRFAAYQEFCDVWEFLEPHARHVAAALWVLDDPKEYVAEADVAMVALSELSHCDQGINLLDGGTSPSRTVVELATRAIYELHPLILTELIAEENLLPMLRNHGDHLMCRKDLKKAGEQFENFLHHAEANLAEFRPHDGGSTSD